MKLKQIHEFIAIADCGSVRLAARRLGMTQPGMTKALRQLEDELGVPLFVRSVRGVSLTQYGSTLLPRARVVQRELGTALEELSQLRGGSGGGVSLAIAPAAAFSLLPAALNAFRRRHRDAAVTILETMFPSGPSLLRAGGAELYVGSIQPDEMGKDLVSEKLLPNDVVITCRLGHPLRDAKSLTDLADSEWLFGGPLGFRGRFLHQQFASMSLPKPKSLLQVESLLACVSIVNQSDVLAVLPRLAYEWEPIKVSLNRIRVEHPLELPPISIIRKADSPISKTAAALINAFRQAAAIST